ncbi:MAG TPA: 6-phosphogluconolactonase [Solirubrobacteraceae bacterium]|nr:6-phosphogluconolactonase [Solirubrobacteraceae bacterium]
MTRLTTCPDDETVARRAAVHIARVIEEARSARGVAHLALSGGTTPGRTYELLGEEPAALESVGLWFADERCVAPDDEESNYRLAQHALIEPASIDPARVHRMRGELGPEEGAAAYAAELCGPGGPQRAEGVPVLDLIVLGIGPDGHVASLFPGAPTLSAGEEAICLGISDSPKPPPERITLSLAVLRAARGCLLLATGASKADAVDAMLAKASPHVPASLLERGRLTVIVDDAAAPRGPVA